MDWDSFEFKVEAFDDAKLNMLTWFKYTCAFRTKCNLFVLTMLTKKKEYFCYGESYL